VDDAEQHERVELAEVVGVDERAVSEKGAWLQEGIRAVDGVAA